MYRLRPSFFSRHMSGFFPGKATIRVIIGKSAAITGMAVMILSLPSAQKMQN